MVLLVNRRAYFDYDISDRIVAGVVLTGAEVKSLRSRAGSLAGSYVQILAEGVVLLGAQISPYPYADNRDYDPRSTRKLLLRRKEIYRLKKRLQTGGLSLVPIAFMIKNGKIKLEIGIGKGKKQFQKRQQIKKRDLQRQLNRGEY